MQTNESILNTTFSVNDEDSFLKHMSEDNSKSFINSENINVKKKQVRFANIESPKSNIIHASHSTPYRTFKTKRHEILGLSNSSKNDNRIMMRSFSEISPIKHANKSVNIRNFNEDSIGSKGYIALQTNQNYNKMNENDIERQNISQKASHCSLQKVNKKEDSNNKRQLLQKKEPSYDPNERSRLYNKLTSTLECMGEKISVIKCKESNLTTPSNQKKVIPLASVETPKMNKLVAVDAPKTKQEITNKENHVKAVPSTPKSDLRRIFLEHKQMKIEEEEERKRLQSQSRQPTTIINKPVKTMTMNEVNDSVQLKLERVMKEYEEFDSQFSSPKTQTKTKVVPKTVHSTKPRMLDRNPPKNNQTPVKSTNAPSNFRTPKSARKPPLPKFR